MRRKAILFILLLLALAALIAFDLLSGLGGDELDRLILREVRIPRVVTAILAGAALSVSGLMMQTLFRNPLAGPYTLGVSSGASLGVALVTMAGVSGALSSLVAAGIVGSTLVLLLVIIIARHIRSHTAMLIIGLMMGSIASALVNLIQNYANPDALKLFITWTFGSLSSVSLSDLGGLAALTLLGLVLSLALIKPLNGLALGLSYARALGIPIGRVRVLIVLATGLMAGAITAYCGPIAFIGVAVPHIARSLMASGDHRTVLPATALTGATILVACDILTQLGDYPLPVSTVSALFGAPVIIWIIARQR